MIPSSLCPHDWYSIGELREACDLCGAVRRMPPLAENPIRLWCPRKCGRAFVRKENLQAHLEAPCAPFRGSGISHLLKRRK